MGNEDGRTDLRGTCGCVPFNQSPSRGNEGMVRSPSVSNVQCPPLSPPSPSKEPQCRGTMLLGSTSNKNSEYIIRFLQHMTSTRRININTKNQHQHEQSFSVEQQQDCPFENPTPESRKRKGRREAKEENEVRMRFSNPRGCLLQWTSGVAIDW